MPNFEERLAALKNTHEKQKAEQIRLATLLEEKEKQRGQIITQLAELGVTPENLEGSIQSVEQELDTLLVEGETKQTEIQAVFNANQTQLAQLEG